MTAPFRTWEVLPHGRLTQIDDNILTVTGDLKMPMTHLQRRMTVVRLQDETRLVVFSAIALDEDGMRHLEQFGMPAFMIVPNDHHRLDAKIWKDRYPKIKVIAPEGAREKVQEIVPVDTTDTDFGDPTIRFVAVPGTRAQEAALEAGSPSGTTLVLNDIIGNIHDAAGLGGWLLRIMGFAGDEPHVPVPVKAIMVEDKAALAAQLRRWSEMPTLKRIIVSHGDMIEHDPKGVLAALAEKLA
jgi:hypothetical protein